MRWIGPVTIDKLLDNVLDSSIPRPPSKSGVYIVSRKEWLCAPTKDCLPLYTGSNTSDSQLFRTRIGGLIADAFGLYDEVKNGGHHSGGISIHKYCSKNKIDPKSLYIGWVEDCKCHRCAETEVWEALTPLLNKNTPTKCSKHRQILRECFSPSGK